MSKNGHKKNGRTSHFNEKDAVVRSVKGEGHFFGVIYKGSGERNHPPHAHIYHKDPANHGKCTYTRVELGRTEKGLVCRLFPHDGDEHMPYRMGKNLSRKAAEFACRYLGELVAAWEETHGPIPIMEEDVELRPLYGGNKDFAAIVTSHAWVSPDHQGRRVTTVADR